MTERENCLDTALWLMVAAIVPLLCIVFFIVTHL